MSTPHESLNHWQPIAERLKEVPHRTYPLTWLIRGARQIAGFLERYWEPTDELPGLAHAGPRLHPGIREEIRSLSQALEQVQLDIAGVLPRETDPARTLEQAESLLQEIQAVLDWVDDVDVELLEHDDLDLQVASAEPVSIAALADTLRDYGSLANLVLSGAGAQVGVDPGIGQQALEVAQRLDQMERALVASPADLAALLELRERLAALLHNRLNLVRQAVRYMFRHHDDVLREAALESPSRRRALHRRAALLYERRQRRKVTQRYQIPHPN